MLNAKSPAVRPSPRRLAAVLAVAGLLAGCGLTGDDTAPTTPSSGSGSVVTSIVTTGQGPIQVDPRTFEQQPNCPRLQLRSETFLITKYEKGKQDDPRHLLYQANIENWARDCRRVGDQVMVKIGLSGRVTPGPVWPGGEIVLPVRVSLLRGSETDAPLQTQMFSIPVTVGSGAPAELWTLVDESFVVPGEPGLRLVFGFDESPQKPGARR
ncbi:hypothetical protein GWI72_11805 [Microvirga tunisiensis]|uniref:Uncharacterized protein n=2 Tax=Pannonibacter tanglangensis TaxID=2750084 RepID=A0A7X5F377_9HYPH|nr:MULTISPECIES: hypothetical protein [unclassified Pannonibacter]NBN64420.1 hypothetical protein [Pannonibacter sp. XCT-34]NBN78952.1 hypothetical protein [Pannonibacter sp. XCT-53]